MDPIKALRLFSSPTIHPGQYSFNMFFPARLLLTSSMLMATAYSASADQTPLQAEVQSKVYSGDGGS
jgi:hypothetical protein